MRRTGPPRPQRLGRSRSLTAASATDRKDELGFRLALYIVCAPLAGAFGGLLASGILKIDHIGPYRTWRLVHLSCFALAALTDALPLLPTAISSW